ncbi:MAG: OmpA family protein [Saprospiraceae bacterium]
MFKHNIIYFLLPFFVLIGSKIMAQPINVSSYEMMLETGENAANENDYVNAVKWFEDAYKESKDPYLLIAIADLNMLMRDYVKAERYYDRVLKKDKTDEFADIRLDYARSMKYQGKYKEAMNELNSFISLINNDSLKTEAKLELRGILNLEKLPENVEASISFANENINTPSAENGPAIAPDGTLYFSSMNTKSPVTLDGNEKEYHTKIYAATREATGGYAKPTALDEAINRVNFHNAGASFSPDGKVMYFTRATLLGNGIETSQLFVSQFNGGTWAPPVASTLNGDYKIRHPYEGELFGQKVLYFSSDMDGGYGGYDLFYAPMIGGDFGTPVNLGPIINTNKNEETPYYRDGVLYFSSNGHPSMGGYDTYYSEWNGSTWSAPANMGYNYNTSYDDTYFRMNKSGNSGFLVSNRPNKDKKKFKASETCCDDIYEVFIRDVVIDLQVLVNNESGPLDGATIELYENAKKGAIEAKNNALSNNFSFLLESDKSYKAFVTRDGYFPDSIEFNTNGIFEDYTFKKTLILKAKPKEDTSDSEFYSINEPIRLNNIYYDFDDDAILPAAEKDLAYLVELMEQYSDMVIELSSHTDSRGEVDYNKKLSQRRANSAKNWLVNEGIDAKRINAVGYGESKLLNKCKDRIKCSEEEHQLNRRTEFKIIAGPQTIEIKKSRLKREN